MEEEEEGGGKEGEEKGEEGEEEEGGEKEAEEWERRGGGELRRSLLRTSWALVVSNWREGEREVRNLFGHRKKMEKKKKNLIFQFVGDIC